MNPIKHFFILLFILGFLNAHAQNVEERFSILLTVHNSEFVASHDQVKSSIGFGIGAKFRLNKESESVNFILGLGIEQWPIQRFYEVEQYYYETNWVVCSLQFGPQLKLAKQLKLQPYVSLDAPFHYTFKWPGDQDRSEIDFRIPYMSFGFGTDVTYDINLIKKVDMFIGVRVKYNTLLAIRSHDFWVFPNDDEYPYHYGLILGYYW